MSKEKKTTAKSKKTKEKPEKSEKKPSQPLDVKQLLIDHCEKIGFGFFALLALILMLSAAGVDSYEKTAKDIQREVSRAKSSLKRIPSEEDFPSPAVPAYETKTAERLAKVDAWSEISGIDPTVLRQGMFIPPPLRKGMNVLNIAAPLDLHSGTDTFQMGDAEIALPDNQDPRSISLASFFPQYQTPETTGCRWVVINAVLPLRKQAMLFTQYARAKGYNPSIDTPQYAGFLVQRVELAAGQQEPDPAKYPIVPTPEHIKEARDFTTKTYAACLAKWHLQSEKGANALDESDEPIEDIEDYFVRDFRNMECNEDRGRINKSSAIQRGNYYLDQMRLKEKASASLAQKLATHNAQLVFGKRDNPALAALYFRAPYSQEYLLSGNYLRGQSVLASLRKDDQEIWDVSGPPRLLPYSGDPKFRTLPDKVETFNLLKQCTQFVQETSFYNLSRLVFPLTPKFDPAAESVAGPKKAPRKGAPGTAPREFMLQGTWKEQAIHPLILDEMKRNFERSAIAAAGFAADGASSDRKTGAPSGDAFDPENMKNLAMLRFVDLTCDLNKRYVYRVALVMFNPNYGYDENELTDASLAKEPFLYSEWTPWTKPVEFTTERTILVGPLDNPTQWAKPVGGRVLLSKWYEKLGRYVFAEIPVTAPSLARTKAPSSAAGGFTGGADMAALINANRKEADLLADAAGGDAPARTPLVALEMAPVPPPTTDIPNKIIDFGLSVVAIRGGEAMVKARTIGVPSYGRYLLMDKEGKVYATDVPSEQSAYATALRGEVGTPAVAPGTQPVGPGVATPPGQPQPPARAGQDFF